MAHFNEQRTKGVAGLDGDKASIFLWLIGIRDAEVLRSWHRMAVKKEQVRG